MGEGGPGGDAEAIALLVQSLRATGLAGLRVGVGDVSLTRAVLDGLGIDRGDAGRARTRALAARNFVEWRRLARAAASRRGRRRRPAAWSCRRCAAGAICWSGSSARSRPRRRPASASRARSTCSTRTGVGDAVILDLGILRDWPYYSGVVVEAYAPGVGSPIAVGGRYDELAARFGRDRPAVGFAITLDLLHQALIAADGAPAPPRAGLVLVGGLDDDLAVAAEVRAAGMPVIALGDAVADPEALAAADGWRWVARPVAAGYTVLDRATGSRAPTPGSRRRWPRGPEDLRAPRGPVRGIGRDPGGARGSTSPPCATPAAA